MTEKENRQNGEFSQSGRDGYKSYNKYSRNEGGNNYGRRPRFNNAEVGARPYRYNYKPNFNNGGHGDPRP